MLSNERAAGPKLQFSSPYGGLFSNNCADPREYFGPPNPRRCGSGGMTPTSHSNSSSTAVSAARRRSSSPGISPVRGMRALSPGEGLKTLENLDLEGPSSAALSGSVVLLDSPRSVEACLRLGLSPMDFFPKPYDALVKEMKDNGEDISDEHIVKMRYSYSVQRAKQKYEAACEERVRLMVESCHERVSLSNDDHNGSKRRDGGGSGGSDNEGMSTRILEEEKRLQKIVENNKNRLRQQLLHAQLVEKQRERENQRMEAQRRADEQQKKHRVREMIERSKKEEEAQALRNEARELERQEQQRRVELKRALYEAKDRQVKERIMKQRFEAEAENEAKRLLNLERQRQMKEQAESVAAERRNEFKRRNELFEAAQQEYKHQLEVRREERLAVAKRKARKIREAILRSQSQEEAKIHRALEKERQADLLRKQQADAAAEAQRLKHQQDEEREVERQAVIREAQLRQQKRVDDLQHKIMTSEEHMAQLQQQRDAEARVRAEIQRQKELDKADCVRRSKYIEEHRIAQLEAHNQEKIERVRRLQSQQEELKEKRKLHREEAERTRIVFEEITPGPSDFVPANGTIGTEGPKWKMGLPASAQLMRVVVPGVPAPGYNSSPGPCVYQYEHVLDARHRKTEAFSMIKHDRWKAQSEAAVTPGPSDYAPASPPFHKSRPNSSAL